MTEVRPGTGTGTGTGIGTITIGLHGLRVRGFHGVLPEERRDGQDFLVDATLEVATPAADDLAQTADYGTLAAELTAAVATDPVDLIETLASRLLAVCLAPEPVRAATVRIHKPSAPIPLPFTDVTVTVSGRRGAGRAVLSLGSNLGDRLGHLQAAVTLLASRYAVEVSPVYETDPVGGPEQEPYLNAVVLLSTRDGSGFVAEDLFEFTSAIEQSRLRERTVRWGPRTLDVDLIDVDGGVIRTPQLTLPHPRAAERAFVLVPWLDLDPAAALPGVGPVAALVAGAAADATGVRPTDLRLEP
jgi:dihydroneopterin aldolase/2-amino-4-hydroxy-6-hydroxymethyldihydropteridine diphosphokinase